MTAVIGIDPSLAGFAWATCTDGGDGVLDITEHILATKPNGDGVRARIERYEHIVGPVVENARQLGASVIVIEGYSYGSNDPSAQERAELGGILRRELLRCGHELEVYEMAPSSLKKFATGVGKGDKAAVISAMVLEHGRRFKSADAADAFACLQVAMCIAGIVSPTTRPKAEVVALVSGHPLPKLTKKQRDQLAQGSLLS